MSAPVLENWHAPGCHDGTICVSCAGCACGLTRRTCEPGHCYTRDQYDADDEREHYYADQDPDYGRDLDYDDFEDDWSECLDADNCRCEDDQ